MDVRGYFGIAMCIAGGLLLVDRMLALIERRRFLRTALRCDAKIVSLREFEIGGDQSSATGVYPTVRFVDESGTDRCAELTVWFNEGKIKIGGTGTAKQFDAILNRLGDKHELILDKSTGGNGPSDQSDNKGFRVARTLSVEPVTVAPGAAQQSGAERAAGAAPAEADASAPQLTPRAALSVMILARSGDSRSGRSAPPTRA